MLTHSTRTSNVALGRRSLPLQVLLGALFTAILVAQLATAFAAGLEPRAPVHTPHDDVDAVRLSPDFANDRTAFAIVRSCVFRSTDGGHRWDRLSRGLGQHIHFDVAVSPDFSSDRTIFVASHGGVHRSTDGGHIFEFFGLELEQRSIRRVLVSPTFSVDRTVLALDRRGGLHRSTDGGVSWIGAAEDAPQISAPAFVQGRFHAAMFAGEIVATDDGGESWTAVATLPDGVRATCVLAGVEEGEILVGTSDRGVLRGAGSPIVFDSCGQGLVDEHVTSLALIPEDGSLVLFASTWHRGVHRLDASTSEWTLGDVGLVTDKQADAFGRPHFSHLVHAGQSEIFLGAFCGIFHSSDGGRTWKERAALPHHLVMGLAVAPFGPEQTALALSTYGAGVSVSGDSGGTWKTNNRGLSATRMTAIGLSPTHATVRLVLSGTFGAVCRSTDGGQQWKLISVIPPAGANFAPIDPHSPPTPVAITWSPRVQK